MSDGATVITFVNLEEKAAKLGYELKACHDGVYLFKKGQRCQKYWSPRIMEVEAFVEGIIEGKEAISGKIDAALIIVDVQNDFCPGGALAVTGGDEVVPVINRLIPLFKAVMATKDWHEKDHCSFSHKPMLKDLSWPRHCVAGTKGADFHPDLEVPKGVSEIYKAHKEEAYSGFSNDHLEWDIKARKISKVYVCGLATDYCVKATALDAVEIGFEVFLVIDACRGVDMPTGTVGEAVQEMKDAGVTVVQSDSLADVGAEEEAEPS